MGVVATLLPHVDVTWGQGLALIVIQTTTDHGQQAQGDCMEDDLGVVDVADTHLGTGGSLHSEEERRERVVGTSRACRGANIRICRMLGLD